MKFYQKNNTSEARGKAIPSMIIYMAVWAACVLWFWLGKSGGGWIMAYSILSFGVILPITTLVIAFRLEWKQDLGYWRWAAIGFFGIMYMAALWATIVLGTFLGAANISTPSLLMSLAGLCPSAIGIAIGWFVRSRKMSLKVPAIGLFLLLGVCYVKLKTLNGSFFRPVLILDVPAVLLLVFGLWFMFRMSKKKQTDQK
ncbi:MAG: hypothetical protein HDT33_08625 [Clostridiales bacterium]|nr:hypothetical protein [Clostridiales bacterium]